MADINRYSIINSSITITEENRRKAGDAIEKLAGEKAREISYNLLHGFAEGLKKQSHKGNKELVSNTKIDKYLKGYKMEVGLEGSKSRAKE